MMLTLLLVIGCSSLVQEEGGSVGTLRFGWPSTGRVRVLEDTLKKGVKARTSYELSWVPAADGKSIVLGYSNYRFLRLNGQDIDSPEMAPEVAKGLREAARLAGVIPGLVIGLDGRLIGFEGLQAMLEELGTPPEGASEEEKQELIRANAAFENPEMIKVLENAMAVIWDAWVASWIDFEYERESSLTFAVDMDATQSIFAHRTLTIDERESFRGVPAVEIMLQSFADEERLKKSLARTMKAFESKPAAGAGNRMKGFKAGRTDILRGIYCTDDLRPSEVFRSVVIGVYDPELGATRGSKETHHYLFLWEDLDPIDFETCAFKIY